MRPHGRRTKKLIVAFHFYSQNRAGWKCDVCRQKGLEVKRRCGWIPDALETPEHVVWVRGKCSVTTCPKSFISAQSLAWLEHYFAWKLSGSRDLSQMEAKTADAICALENEVRAEGNHGER